jgi:hypothetical protein
MAERPVFSGTRFECGEKGFAGVYETANNDNFINRVKVAIVGQLWHGDSAPQDVINAKSWLGALPQYCVAHLDDMAPTIALGVVVTHGTDCVGWDDWSLFAAVREFMAAMVKTKVPLPVNASE